MAQEVGIEIGLCGEDRSHVDWGALSTLELLSPLFVDLSDTKRNQFWPWNFLSVRKVSQSSTIRALMFENEGGKKALKAHTLFFLDLEI